MIWIAALLAVANIIGHVLVYRLGQEAERQRRNKLDQAERLRVWREEARATLDRLEGDVRVLADSHCPPDAMFLVVPPGLRRPSQEAN